MRTQRTTGKRTYALRSMPPEMDVQLLYTDVRTFGSGTASQTLRTVPNSYVIFGSGDTSAEFVRYASLYDFYRVVRFRVDLELSNNEAFPVACSLFAANEDPGSTYSFPNSAGMPFSKTCLLAAKGGGADTKRLSLNLRVATLAGSNAPEVADSYRAVINTAPVDVVWANLTVASATGASMTTGVSLSWKTTQFIRFYNADLVSQDTPPTIVDVYDAPFPSNKARCDEIVRKREIRKLSHAPPPQHA